MANRSFWADIDYHNEDGSPSSASTGTGPKDKNGYAKTAESLDEIKGGLIDYINYYAGELGRTIDNIRIVEICGVCGGSGVIVSYTKTRRRKEKKCPGCQGKNAMVKHL